MSITDELRRFIKDPLLGYVSRSQHIEVLTKIADRIDAEHESACAEAYGNGVMSVPIALDESQWVKLPVDADGVPIHVGDEMVLQHEVAEKPYTVQSLTWDGEDWYFTCDEGFFNACGWMHHRAPTVEDVLREFALDVCKDDALTIREGVVEKYAAKLRLAEEVDA